MAETKSKSRSRSGSSANRRTSGGSSKDGRRSSSDGRRSSSDGRRSSGDGRSSRSSGGRPPREIVAEAVQQLQELIARPIESVTGIEKNGNEWTLMLEVLELERVPNTTDVLGQYEVTVDKNGDLTGAHRTRRYHRAEAGED